MTKKEKHIIKQFQKSDSRLAVIKRRYKTENKLIYTYAGGWECGYWEGKTQVLREFKNIIALCFAIDITEGYHNDCSLEEFRKSHAFRENNFVHFTNKHGLVERILDWLIGESNYHPYHEEILEFILPFYIKEIKTLDALVMLCNESSDRYRTFYDGQSIGFLEGKLTSLESLVDEIQYIINSCEYAFD